MKSIAFVCHMLACGIVAGTCIMMIIEPSINSIFSGIVAVFIELLAIYFKQE